MRSSGRKGDAVNVRLPWLAIAVLAGILIGMLLEAAVDRVVPGQPWRAAAYVTLTAAVFVLTVRGRK